MQVLLHANNAGQILGIWTPTDHAYQYDQVDFRELGEGIMAEFGSDFSQAVNELPSRMYPNQMWAQFEWDNGTPAAEIAVMFGIQSEAPEAPSEAPESPSEGG